MCGPAGSGKSTVARQLESGGMSRLSFDEEAWRLGIRSQPLAEDVRREIESHLVQKLLDLVSTHSDVVLDYSFWSRRMREEYRAVIRPLGIEPETFYLATPRSVVLARICARAGQEANDVQLPDHLAAAYFDNFEIPTPDEGPLTVITYARCLHPDGG
ncbi:ATP-binding protein [Cryobacterium zongtaii]|uniref:ATP-binding protein n=2 Tax=Cryobacterium zongtaii TaxID=1259217 RepID=A0A2S3ZDK3_9MICO|nr:ATP-binding protein [Cryobacterium zongtaii]